MRVTIQISSILCVYDEILLLFTYIYWRQDCVVNCSVSIQNRNHSSAFFERRLLNTSLHVILKPFRILLLLLDKNRHGFLKIYFKPYFYIFIFLILNKSSYPPPSTSWSCEERKTQLLDRFLFLDS